MSFYFGQRPLVNLSGSRRKCRFAYRWERGTYEGGMREPAYFQVARETKARCGDGYGLTMDLLPTFSKLTNVNLPNDRIYDGFDITPVMFGTGKDPRDIVYYYRDTDVFAIRKGNYKAHFFTQPEYGSEKVTAQDPPLLYNLNVDPSEKNNIAKKYPMLLQK